jgi:hypothetical protein
MVFVRNFKKPGFNNEIEKCIGKKTQQCTSIMNKLPLTYEFISETRPKTEARVFDWSKDVHFIVIDGTIEKAVYLK